VSPGDLIALLSGAALLVGSIGSAIAWLVWPRLMQAIRRELGPMQAQVAETHKQVTENHHSNDQPTVLDLLSDLSQDNLQLRADIARVDERLGDEIRKVDKRVDDHLLTANKADADMWRAIEAVAKGTPPEDI
jgi:hypothetical protein